MGPREILRGLWHWTAPHPKIGIEEGTYFVQPARG